MEKWATVEELIAVRERLEAADPRWRRPAAYAVGVIRDGRTGFTMTNRDGNYLPAVILARVTGHSSGSATYPLSVEQLETAEAELAPAEACKDVDHPTLHHWRALIAEVTGEGGQLVAVFVGDLEQEPVDEHDRALRAALERST